MLYMISYDIRSDRRRAKMHRLLKNYGEWMQYSIFECRLSAQEYQELRRRMEPLLEAETGDSLCIYHVCGACQRHTEHIGGHPARLNEGIVL